jgi:NAD(P)-dependent dehydrogenase (short-subunit alcohol dehydrogenase family)
VRPHRLPHVSNWWGTSFRTQLGRRTGASDFFQRRVLAVTGGGSGIGRELAVQVSRRGARVAIADLDEGKAQETRALCADSERVEIFSVDVAEYGAVEDFAAGVIERFGSVDTLVTCAGVLQYGSVASTPVEDFDAIMSANYRGTVAAVKAFLPHLLAADRAARIATVSSAVGLVGVAGSAPYVASKFAIRGFAESLRAETMGTNVSVSCVFPGGIRTPIAHSALFAPDVDRARAIARFDNTVARTDVATAARAILAGLESGRPRVLIGADAWLAEVAARVAGPNFEKIVKLAAKLA